MQCSRESVLYRIIWDILFPSSMTQASPITIGCTSNFALLCECGLRKSVHLGDRGWAISSHHIIKEREMLHLTQAAKIKTIK